MLSPEQAQARCQALVERARAAGADAADALYAADASQSVQVRLGKLEDVERSESEHASLRVFVGRGTASIGSSDLSDTALGELATRAVAMARAAPEDKFAGLAPEDMLLRSAPPQLDLSDPREVSPAELRARAETAEDAARSVAGVTNSEGGSASVGAAVVALATSAGFCGGYASSSHSLSASVIAGVGADMQRDYAWRVARHADGLPGPGEIGLLAGQRAVGRLNPQPRFGTPRTPCTILYGVAPGPETPFAGGSATAWISKTDSAELSPSRMKLVAYFGSRPYSLELMISKSVFSAF